MKSYLTFEPGVPELEEFAPHCWVHVECPDEDDFMFLTKELGIPREFLSDIADIDERPRAEREDDWLLTILRIPMDGGGPGMPLSDSPLGSSRGIVLRLCLLQTYAALTRLHQSYPTKEYRYLPTRPSSSHV